MRRSGIYAVIPVKSFARAKQRMSPFLSSAERARLARFMFEDVLDAVLMSRSLAGCLVVTHSASASRIAHAAGVMVVNPQGEFGVSAAVSSAANALPPDAGMAVVPTDIPHISSAFLDRVASLTLSPGVTLVPAISDGGTNLLAMRPCTALPPLYGENSFARHRNAARLAGIPPVIWHSAEAGRDLDRPADLAPFLALNSDTRAHYFLSSLDLAARFEAMPESAGLVSA
jgi:2-phospho-L-lactate guanylyltransferase